MTERSFIELLCKRIFSFLPSRTGHSITEIELNPQFIEAKRILIETHNKYPHIVAYILESFAEQLKLLDDEANFTKFRLRDERSVATTLMLCKMLALILKENWHRKKCQFSDNVADFEIVSNYSWFCYYDKPSPLDPKHVPDLINTFIELLSSKTVRKVLTLVKSDYTVPVTKNKLHQQKSPPPHHHMKKPATASNVSMVNHAINHGVVNLAKKVNSHKKEKHVSPERLTMDEKLSSPSSVTQASTSSVSTKSTVSKSSHSALISPKSIKTTHSHSTHSGHHSSPANTGSSSTSSFTAGQGYKPLSSSPLAETTALQVPSEDDARMESYITELDYYLELILRYIATANPGDYYEFLHQRIFKYCDTNDVIPPTILQAYCPLIKFMFFSTENSKRSAFDNLRAISYIKNVSWKLTFITLITVNIRNQLFARPVDFLSIIRVENVELESLCKDFFDYTYHILEERNEDSTNRICSTFVQTWLCILCISDFIEFETGKLNKLRMEFNKRIKFLASVIQDSTNLANLECFSSLINIFHVGARLKSYDENHPIAKFTMKYIDLTHDNLLKYPKDAKNYDENDHENLIISFYLAALMVDSDKYVKILIQKFIDYKDNIREVKLLVKIIKGISESDKTIPIFNQIMKTLAVPLKSMIFGSEKILRRYESLNQQSSNSSSCASIYSDILSIDSETHQQQFTMNPLFQTKSDNDLLKGLLKVSLDHYLNDQDSDNVSSQGSVNSASGLKARLLVDTETMLADLFRIFIAAPELYFNDAILMDESNLEKLTHEEVITSMAQYAQEVTTPLKQAFKTKTSANDKELFDAACLLALTIAEKGNKLNTEFTTLSTFANFLTANLIVKSICEASLSWSITDPKFKATFILINDFLERREEFVPRIAANSLIRDKRTDSMVDLGGGATQAIEKILLLSLCTHEIQFYNIANKIMMWYVKIVKTGFRHQNLGENLCQTFERIISEESVFTGFVSLHKKFRNILRVAKPTKSLYQVWLIIYSRWLEMLELKLILDEENLLFKHFTGFLISTSGCFLWPEFLKDDQEQRQKAAGYISDLFDKCITLLSSKDLVIRVIIKETMSYESHSNVYHLIATKLFNLANFYTDKKLVTDESQLFIEQAIVIITAMIQVKNDGAFIMLALLPEFYTTFFKFIDMTESPREKLKLKLRFCKLIHAIESEKHRFGVQGSFRIRNMHAKKTTEWLERALFTELDLSNLENTEELRYLNADMAHQCSRCLSLQLEGIVLDIPEGTKDSEVRKYKDLTFGNYFSIFYKIIQKYCNENVEGNKSKYKINLIADNILKCISNILQSDTDIGMQFVLPLGYHQNRRIRALFLNVFANMLTSRKSRGDKEEYQDAVIFQLTDLYEVYGAVAEAASSTEHNLLASALYGVFRYTKSLDKLFDVLLHDEINRVSRSTDIFRRNSTLTRLLSNFAKENGKTYLEITIKPFVDDLIKKSVTFEVEKADVATNEDAELFISYFTRLIDVIIHSTDSLPLSLRLICCQIYNCVKSKFEEASLVAVGSFLFLRFICPAIVSPETFVDLPVSDPKIKRSLMQLVKVLQNVANDSLGLLKWHSLAPFNPKLIEAKKQIYLFLKKIATDPITEYPFPESGQKPIAELRYLHKFLYTYFSQIKVKFVVGADVFTPVPDLHVRVVIWRKLDSIFKTLALPKSSVQLQLHAPFKTVDPNNTANNKFNDFMTKMSLTYSDVSDNVIIRNSIFNDGTPVVVLNFRHLVAVNNDIRFMVYKLFEIANQVWDNTFYMVYDFTEYVLTFEDIKLYCEILIDCGPIEIMKNCARVYYFNIPIEKAEAVADATKMVRKDSKKYGTKLYVYSLADEKEIINSLNLDPLTVSVTKDTRVVFNHAKLYISKTNSYLPVSIRLGRQYVLICSEQRFPYGGEIGQTSDFAPVEVYRLMDITKCEVSTITEHSDEFTIFMNYDHLITLRSNDRLEILRFLYFSTSRLAKTLDVEKISKDADADEHVLPWFGRLYNIVFQGLLCSNEEVKLSASALFASLSTYFEIDFGIKTTHAKNVAFPTNIMDFVVSVSSHLSKIYPKMTYRFFKAFFDNYEKVPEENKLSSIMFLAPWIENIYEFVYIANDDSGEERVTHIIRQFSRLSLQNRAYISFLNDYIWKKLFAESALLPILVDEVVAFAIDNNTNENTDWAFITAVISPSVEVCGEVVKKLITCVNKAKCNDSAIASRSKLFEIRVLVKICSSLFFNSYTITRLYLADIFLLVTLFIDNVYLDFGADLQKLTVNLIQSFYHKPNLTEEEQVRIDDSIEYFSSQRAKMLFGVTREISNSNSTGSGTDTSQAYNRALNFEVLCDYLNDFITTLGNVEDRNAWRSQWISNAIDVAFSTDSIFQTRALLVVGILSKSGVVDSVASKILKYIATNEIKSLDVIINLAISSSRVIQGLPLDSPLPSIMIWPQFGLGLLNYAALYQSSATIFVHSLVKIIESGGDYVEKALENRKLLEPHMTNFANDHGFSINKQNFDFYVFFVLTQGLRIAQLKQTSISSLQTCFKAMLKYNRARSSGCELGRDILAMVYLSVSDKQFSDYLEEIDLKTEFVTISSKVEAPKIITDFFLSNSESAKVALIQGAYLYSSSSVDCTFKTRFLPIMSYVLQNNPDLGLLVCHILKEPMEEEFISTSSNDVVCTISDINSIILLQKEYSNKKYEQMVDEYLIANKISIIKSGNDPVPHMDINIDKEFGDYVSEDIRGLQEMVYRAAYHYVEGSKLEE